MNYALERANGYVQHVVFEGSAKDLYRQATVQVLTFKTFEAANSVANVLSAKVVNYK